MKLLGFKASSNVLLIPGIFASVAGYVLSHNPIFALVCFACLVSLFVKDVLPKSWNPQSIKNSVIELVIAFFSALAIWLALTFILQTASPIDVVTSCSMVPALDRGDLIILQGGQISAQSVQLRQGNTALGLVKEPCTLRNRDGASRPEQCTVGAFVNDKPYNFTREGDIIVYEPQGSSSRLGLIIHRVVLKLVTPEKTLYITKGDNNARTDLEGLSLQPVDNGNVHGKMIARIPYLGYLKLFLALQFNEPEACQYTITKP